MSIANLGSSDAWCTHLDAPGGIDLPLLRVQEISLALGLMDLVVVAQDLQAVAQPSRPAELQHPALQGAAAFCRGHVELGAHRSGQELGVQQAVQGLVVVFQRPWWAIRAIHVPHQKESSHPNHHEV